jgi:hypothetical protein
VLNFILQALFQSAHHLYEKREGSGSVHLTNESGPGGLKTCESGSPALRQSRYRNAVFRIRDILVQIRILRSLPFTKDSDPTPFFRDFKDAKNCFFPPSFSYNSPAGTLSSVFNRLL